MDTTTTTTTTTTASSAAAAAAGPAEPTQGDVAPAIVASAAAPVAGSSPTRRVVPASDAHTAPTSAPTASQVAGDTVMSGMARVPGTGDADSPALAPVPSADNPHKRKHAGDHAPTPPPPRALSPKRPADDARPPASSSYSPGNPFSIEKLVHLRPEPVYSDDDVDVEEAPTPGSGTGSGGGHPILPSSSSSAVAAAAVKTPPKRGRPRKSDGVPVGRRNGSSSTKKVEPRWEQPPHEDDAVITTAATAAATAAAPPPPPEGADAAAGQKKEPKAKRKYQKKGDRWADPRWNLVARDNLL